MTPTQAAVTIVALEQRISFLENNMAASNLSSALTAGSGVGTCGNTGLGIKGVNYKQFCFDDPDDLKT